MVDGVESVIKQDMDEAGDPTGEPSINGVEIQNCTDAERSRTWQSFVTASLAKRDRFQNFDVRVLTPEQVAIIKQLKDDDGSLTYTDYD
jgi:hypothetical protein